MRKEVLNVPATMFFMCEMDRLSVDQMCDHGRMDDISPLPVDTKGLWVATSEFMIKRTVGTRLNKYVRLLTDIAGASESQPCFENCSRYHLVHQLCKS